MDNVAELLSMLQRDIAAGESHSVLAIKVQNIRAELERAMTATGERTDG